ncbi:CDP-glycerol glycerophosphotransferase family protein [Halobacillus sp. A1]|uniref:CDP-glycerol glycerophosphotransferase family protein n=1 Tax=Halobacillus sp. A1 TaxID=2880262 RepID=UPI0020A691E0|nr:CDP-glycerol glycerophosphotransferase family protein [Halobacillus sp. A1]MCP3029928.1 CDP-glycerol glycerophosphotransferase family protein [Halobacillus sp. A1]
MNTVERNIWSLYYEFLETFKILKYKGFSIPYLCHFRSLITDNQKVYGRISSENFLKSLRYEIKDKQSFQQLFNAYKRYHVNKSKSKLAPKAVSPEGKVVLYDAAKLLRFPKEIIDQHFKPSDTIVLHDLYTKNKKNKIVKGIPIEGLPCHYLHDYRANVSSNIHILQTKAAEIISSFKGHPMFNDKTFKQIFNKQIEGIVHRIEEASRFFNKNPVSCIVFSSTHYYQSRTIAMVAAEVGIPTICMQHGIIGNEIGFIPQIADVEAVYGNFEAEWFKRLGVHEQSVEVIGHPRFDTIHLQPSISRKRMERKLGLKRGKKLILMVVRDNQQIKKWEAFINSLGNNEDYNIIVRDYPQLTPHPLTSKYPFLSSSQHFQLYDLIRHSDLVVTYLSTVALEAMIADKPVFILSTPFPNYTGYYDSLGELVETDPVRYADLIHRYFNDKEMKKLAKERRVEFLEQAYPIAELSGERLKNLIDRLSSDL